MKKYIATTTISISVCLPAGNGTRVSFSPLSDGRSVFYTSDKDIQWALEHHYKYGKLFSLTEETQDEKTVAKSMASHKKRGRKGANSVAPTQSDSDPAEEIVDETQDEEAPEYIEVEVSDMDAAKDYLADKFEIVRTKLKKEEDIEKAALSHGVVFKYP